MNVAKPMLFARERLWMRCGWPLLGESGEFRRSRPSHPVSVELGTGKLLGSLCPAKLCRRGTEAPAEAAVEVRQVVEAAAIGDVNDLAMAIGRAFQHGARLLQSQCGDAVGEWHARFLQQTLN